MSTSPTLPELPSLSSRNYYFKIRSSYNKNQDDFGKFSSQNFDLKTDFLARETTRESLLEVRGAVLPSLAFVPWREGC
jgi:hypothetical protein